jgi:hypothetical protein
MNYLFLNFNVDLNIFDIYLIKPLYNDKFLTCSELLMKYYSFK